MFEIQAVLLICDWPEKLEGFWESLGAVIAMSKWALLTWKLAGGEEKFYSHKQAWEKFE